jgi:hypothetical protein
MGKIRHSPNYVRVLFCKTLYNPSFTYIEIWPTTYLQTCMHNFIYIYHTHVCTINSVTVYWDIKQSVNVGTLNKSRERNHCVPCCGTDSQWPSYSWCSLPYSLTHPLLYYLQLPQEIALCPMPVIVTCFWILYWTWNSKLWSGLSWLE